MILSRRHRLIFVHPGKTGGTSIEATLGPILGIEFERTWRNDDVVVGGDCKHVSAARLREIVGEETWDGCFKFGFVRNPFDRLLSEWCMHKQADPERPWVRAAWVRYADFSAFLDGVVRGEVELDRDYQSWMLTGDDGRLLVDFVGRFERLAEDFAHVCRTAGLPTVPLSHRAATTHRPWRDYYNDERLRAVHRSCSGDCALFGYALPAIVRDPAIA